jgi:altronate dehydratase large subunit
MKGNKMELEGYRRMNGKIGVRNHLLFLATVVCSNTIVRGIANTRPDVVGVENNAGCVALTDDQKFNHDMLLGLARNPNVGAVVFVGLGCEQTPAKDLFLELEGEKPVAYVHIQEEGGTSKTLEKCHRLAKQFIEEIHNQPKQTFGMDEFVIATKCGGSDWTTTIASNPAVGIVSDRVVQAGGTSLMGETAGWFGAEEALLRRVRNEQIKLDILRLLYKKYEESERRGTKIEEANPTPGNIAGGITTLAEKAMGTIKKSGESPIEGVLSIGEYPRHPGLWLMDNPGMDIGSISGMAGAGAQIILFTTGRGTPAGSPICPVIKISASPQGMKLMGENIDVDISDIITDGASIISGADRIEIAIQKVGKGQLTRSELLGHREFIMPQMGVL